MVKDGGGWWRMVEDGGGWWRMVEDGGGWWRMVEDGGGWWRMVEVKILKDVDSPTETARYMSPIQLPGW
jgi:hypothetical protein